MNLFKNDFTLKEDEYLSEDMIFCKKCHTPRLFKSEDGEFVGRCLCKCQAEARDIEAEKQLAQQHLDKIKAFREASLIGRRYQNSTFANLDLDRPPSFIKAAKRCEAYCKNWQIVKQEGYGIYFFGTVGTGKTELAACIANYLIDHSVQVLMTNFLEISKLLRESYNRDGETEKEIIDKLANIDLLIFDDMGVEKLIKNGKESFLQEKIYDLINRRYTKKYPTIYTSNYSIGELVNDRGLEKRTADRIAETSVAVIRLDGSSYREKLVKTNTVF